MKTNSLFLFICALSTLFFTETFSQVSINSDGTSPDPSSMLDVNSTTKGMLIPRMTATERDAISNPATGLLIFCTDNNHIYSNQGTPAAKNWVMLNSQWITSGTKIYYTGGNVGIGTTDPSFLLHVVGGNVKIGNAASDSRKLYFGDGSNIYIGEEAVDNRLGLFGNTLTINIGGTTGSPGQILTSNGTLCSWVDPSVTGSGTFNYLARWGPNNWLANGVTRDNSSTVGINTAPDELYRLKVDGTGYNTAIYGRYDDNHYGSVGTASYGAAGYNAGNAAGNAGVYGFSNSSAVGTHGIYGYNQTSTNGTSYVRDNTVNGVAGYIDYGYPYHFGIFGSRHDDPYGPSAGVFGSVDYSDGGKPWGALGFQDAALVEYSGYFNGNIKITGGLNDGTGYGVSGSVLQSNGSNDVYWSANTGVTGSGTSSYIPKWSGSATLSNSLLYDNGTSVCIGTTTPSGKLTVNSGGGTTSVYGQYTSNVLGYLGSSTYGAYGQSSATQFGYLGGLSYGSYGQYSSTLYGYLGGSSYGVYGQNGASITGHLAGSSYGAYGQNNASRFGYLGGANYGAYGQNSSSLYGYLGGASYGAYGQTSSTLYGYLGGASYGAYGQYSSTQYGYLGSFSYGVWGQYSATRYGSLGFMNYGAHGQYNNDIYGELGTSSYGVNGYHGSTGGAAGYFYHSGIPGSFLSQWAVDGYMTNSLANDGSSYIYNTSGNNSGCLRGFNYDGATYTFAVAGWNFNDDNRCAGVFGSSTDATYWGALGYRSSASSNYGGYFTSSGSGSGKSAGSGSAEGIGVGAWGDLIGADIHGGVYGIYVEGNNFGIYSKGPVFSDQPSIQLQDVGEPDRAVIYSSSSTDVTVMTCGQGNLVNGHCSVIFDEKFRKVISQQIPVIITVTPTGPSNGVYISSSDDDGFSVTENNEGGSNIDFSYMAVGRRAGYENPQIPAEVMASDFESNISEGLHNDAEIATDGKGLYYQDGTLRLGHSASMSQNSKKD